LSIKIRGGTARSDSESLCKTCRLALRIKGPRQDDEITICGHYGNQVPVPFTVVECNCWDDRTKADVHTMARMAWVVSSDKKGGKIGFLSPSERREKGIKIGPLSDADGTRWHGVDNEDD
jgi:hypothetical protein